ncbi:MAG: 30S ribosomal protein S6 [Alphaproteobacteria bacterium]|jgi:small subunit ribosomal protein S6
MALYEHVVIARQDVSSAQVDAIVEELKNVLETNGGTIVGTENWGLKSLAYRIKKNRKGHYVMLNLDAPAAAISELERNERIHEDILRYLTLRVDEHAESPSVMLQGRKERGDRGDRGERRERRDRDDNSSMESE